MVKVRTGICHNSEAEGIRPYIKAKEKAIREAQTKASDIDAAVYDLKAVNPNVEAVTNYPHREADYRQYQPSE